MVSLPSRQAIERGWGNRLANANLGIARRIALHCNQEIERGAAVDAIVRRADREAMNSGDSLVFVHGYNVSFDNAVRRIGQIAHDMKFSGKLFLFSWPSRGQLLSYFSDRETVDIAANNFAIFVDQVVNPATKGRVHIIAHSMGNLVAMKGLEIALRSPISQQVAIGEFIHAAPDVDPDLFAELVTKFRGDKGGGTTLYAASNDRPLWLSGLLRDRPRAGYVQGAPLIVAGVESIDISAAGSGIFALNHDIYSENPAVVADIRQIIESGLRPPHLRSRELEVVTTGDGIFWRLLPTKVD